MQTIRGVAAWLLRQMCERVAQAKDASFADLAHASQGAKLLASWMADGRFDDIMREAVGKIASHVAYLGTLALREEEDNGG